MIISYNTCKKISDKKPSEIFKRPKHLKISKTTLVSRNKPDVIRKGLEMAGIVEAVTQEPQDSFEGLVVDH